MTERVLVGLITTIAILLFIIGFLQIKDGASANSKYYAIDDIAIRIIGVLYMIASFGIFKKSEFFRKTTIALFIVSFLEILITHNFDNYSLQINIKVFGLTLLLFLIPFYFLIHPRVRILFT